MNWPADLPPLSALERLPEEERLQLAAALEARIAPTAQAVDDLYSVAPYLTFTPHPGQFHAVTQMQLAVDKNKLKFGVFCGNGWGKTQKLVNLIWAIMCEPQSRSPYFRQPFIENWQWPKHLRLVCMSEDLKDYSGEIWKSINQWWPRSEYETQKQEHSYVSLYKHKRTGFILDIRTFDQEAKQHESSTLGAVFFNEPPPPYIWSVYPSRFRKGGLMVAFATLLFESEFFKDDVIDSPDAAYIFGDVHQNCRQCSTETVLLDGQPTVLHGYLDHEQIETTLRNSPYHLREAKRTGRPAHLAGAAFPIRPEAHFIPRSKLPPLASLTTYSVTDPHQRRPWARIIGGVDKHGIHYLLDEWPKIDTAPWNLPYHKITSDDRGLREYAKLIRTQDEAWNVRDRIIDAKFAAQSDRGDQFSQSLRRTLEWEHNLFFVDGNTHVRGQDGGIRALLDIISYDDTKPVDFTNQPRLFVCDDLWNTCYQLSNVTWDENADPSKYGTKEVLAEKLLDFPRLVMYFIMHGARYLAPVAKRESRSETDLAQERAAQRRMQLQETVDAGEAAAEEVSYADA